MPVSFHTLYGRKSYILHNFVQLQMNILQITKVYWVGTRFANQVRAGDVPAGTVALVKVIQPNCRTQFAAEDVDFILSVLGTKVGTAECLVKLLADEDTRDLILDDEALLHALLERRGCLRVTTHFYFYILVRQVLRRSHINDRAVADYVAEVLSEFAQADQASAIVPGTTAPMNYFFELLAALQTADDRTAFMIRAHVGNYSLFLSGVFPERIRFRAERKGFPALSYYESLGRAHYRADSDHQLARRYELAGIFDTLAEHFQTARRALNDMTDRLITLGDPDYSLDALLSAKEKESD